MRKLRLAIHIPEARRCGADHDAMPVVPGGRHCRRCDHVVTDLSAMTRREAEKFVATIRRAPPTAGPRVCCSYSVDPDGRVVHAQEPARAPVSAALALGLAACTPWGPGPGTEIPDDTSAVHDDPSILIPDAEPRDRPPHALDPPTRRLAADAGPHSRPPHAIDPTRRLADDPPDPDGVRYPRTPVPVPVHEPRPGATDDDPPVDLTPTPRRVGSRRIMGDIY